MLLSPLPVSYYNTPVLTTARALLGTRLVRRMDDRRVAGYIVETEAYVGESDLACHAKAGLTRRTEVMYGPPGRAYVYFIYGMHWMFNVVSEPEGSPGAVLVRALVPDEGQDLIAARRKGVRPEDWTNGPARLCQALNITGALNGTNLTDPGSDLVIERGFAVADEAVITGPRVGIERVPEPWRSMPWRMRIRAEEMQAWKHQR